jgi:hypothetical protein
MKNASVLMPLITDGKWMENRWKVTPFFFFGYFRVENLSSCFAFSKRNDGEFLSISHALGGRLSRGWCDAHMGDVETSRSQINGRRCERPIACVTSPTRLYYLIALLLCGKMNFKWSPPPLFEAPPWPVRRNNCLFD